MSMHDVAVRIRQTIRTTEAEARVERECATILKETRYNAGYVERREADAAKLEKAVEHLNAALAALGG